MNRKVFDIIDKQLQRIDGQTRAGIRRIEKTLLRGALLNMGDATKYLKKRLFL